LETVAVGRSDFERVRDGRGMPGQAAVLTGKIQNDAVVSVQQLNIVLA
jgi:hypothetical protein